MSAEEHQAAALAAWLDDPSGGAPSSLDSDVIEGVFALRPALAPPPRLTAAQVLADVLEGPLALPAADALAASKTADWLASAEGTPADVDSDVLEGVTALRPELAPMPTVDLDALMDDVQRAALVGGEPSTLAAGPPPPANNKRWYLAGALGGSGLLASAAALLFTATVSLQNEAKDTVAAADPTSQSAPSEKALEASENEESAPPDPRPTATRAPMAQPTGSATQSPGEATQADQLLDREEKRDSSSRAMARPSEDPAPLGDVGFAGGELGILDQSTGASSAGELGAEWKGGAGGLSTGGESATITAGSVAATPAASAPPMRATKDTAAKSSPRPRRQAPSAPKREEAELFERQAPTAAPPPPPPAPARPSPVVTTKTPTDATTASEDDFAELAEDGDFDSVAVADAGPEPEPISEEFNESLDDREQSLDAPGSAVAESAERRRLDLDVARDRDRGFGAKKASNVAEVATTEEASAPPADRSPTEPSPALLALQARALAAVSPMVTGVSTLDTIRAPQSSGQKAALQVANSALQSGDLALADRAARDGLSLGANPTRHAAQLHYVLGVVAQRQGDERAAERAFREALRTAELAARPPDAEPQLMSTPD